MRKPLKFLFVGVLNTLIGLFIIYAAMGLFHFSFIASNSIGYSVGMIVSFGLNRAWTFCHAAPWQISFPKWLALAGVCYCFNLIVACLARYVLVADPYFAQLFGTVAYATASFLGARQFVFSTTGGSTSR